MKSKSRPAAIAAAAKARNQNAGPPTTVARPPRGQPGTQAPSGGQGPAAGGDGLKITPESVLASMKIPPDQMPAFARIVKAGITLMTNEKTHGLLLQALQGPGPVTQKLAKGIDALMKILWHQSNNTLPPRMLIPAATYLLVWAAHFCVQSRLITIDDKGIAQAQAMMMQEILVSLKTAQQQGASPAGGGPGANQPAPGAPGPGGGAPGQPAPGGGGLLAGGGGAAPGSPTQGAAPPMPPASGASLPKMQAPPAAPAALQPNTPQPR